MVKAQAATEFLFTYGWALLLLIVVIGVLAQLGVFDFSSYITPGSEVVGFNSFGITRFRIESDGAVQIALVNLLEDTVMLKEVSINGNALSSFSPPLPLNITPGSNVTLTATSSFTGSPGSRYSAKVSMRFDVIRGTADHYDTGTLNGLYVPS